MNSNFETPEEKRYRVHLARETALLHCITTAAIVAYLPVWVFGIYLALLLVLYISSLAR